MNLEIKARRPLVGIEIGEHLRNFRDILVQAKWAVEEGLGNFILLRCHPHPIPRHIWYEWAKFFREHQIYFAFLYTAQRGAPPGKPSHLSEVLVREISDLAGEFFIGDMLGELAGLLSWWRGYFDGSIRHIEEAMPFSQDLESAQKAFIDYVKRFVALDRSFNVPQILAVEPTPLFKYLLEAGVDVVFARLFCGVPELSLAACRGASRAYKRKDWGSHIAIESYGGYRQEDPLKFRRFQTSLYLSYLAGATIIYPESGLYSFRGEEKESPAAKENIRIMKEFLRFADTDARPQGEPKTTLGFISGNLDGWTDYGSATLWGQFEREDWIYGAPEASWRYLFDIYHKRPWSDPALYGSKDQSGQIPYGQYDIVPFEAPLEVLKNYAVLIFLGWNTMTEEGYERLLQYVASGGHLYISLAHLGCGSRREGEFRCIRGGDLTELFGFQLEGQWLALDHGIRFVKEPEAVALEFPVRARRQTDPLYSVGKLRLGKGKIKEAKVLATLTDTGKPERDKPFLLEKKRGQGAAYLTLNIDYPGAMGLEPFIRMFLGAILAAEQGEIRLLGSDAVRWAVYETGQETKIYLLNTAFDFPVECVVEAPGIELPLKLEPCGLVSIVLKKGEGGNYVR